MKKEDLLKTAQKLQRPTKETVTEYSEKLDSLVSEMNNYMLSRVDIEQMIGTDNKEMMKDNHANHARFMESLFSDYNPEVLVDTVLWVFRAYRSRNFSSTYWAAQLNGWLMLYKKNLSKSCFQEVEPFYAWMQINIPVFNTLAEDALDAPLSSH